MKSDYIKEVKINYNSTLNYYDAEIEFIDTVNNFDFIELQMQGINGEIEILWDGMLINNDSEKNYLRRKVRLSHSQSSSGLHQLQIRLSQAQDSQKIWLAYSLFMTDKQNSLKQVYRFRIGIYSIAFVFMIALFIGTHGERYYLYFGLFTLFLCIKIFPVLYQEEILIEQYKYKDSYFAISSVGWQVMLALFVYKFFEIPFRIYFVIMALIASIYFYSTGVYGNVLIYLFLIPFSLYSFLKKRDGSLIITIGLFVTSILMIIQFEGLLSGTYSYGIFTMFFSFVLAISRKIYTSSMHLKLLEIQKNRLENERIKKSIQPHFIMNTLLSVISWIPKQPNKAVQLIKHLSDEFKFIYKYSNKGQILLNEELDICLNHINLMNLRLDKHFEFIITNNFESAKIPPLTIHTLIENAITHSYEVNESGCFTFDYQESESEISYELRNNGSKIKTMNIVTIEEGLGLSYIRLCFKEIYGDKFNIDYKITEDFEWIVSIKVSK